MGNTRNGKKVGFTHPTRLNNPLKYTDPTGYINWWLVGAGIFTIAASVATAGAIGLIAAPAIMGGVAATSTATTFTEIALGVFEAIHTAPVVIGAVGVVGGGGTVAGGIVAYAGFTWTDTGYTGATHSTALQYPTLVGNSGFTIW